jgi:hypothetical protein
MSSGDPTIPGMRWLAALAWFAIVAAARSLDAGATTPPPDHAGVRIGIVLDGTPSAPGRSLATMIAEADAIWRTYGVRVTHPPPEAWGPHLVRLTLRVEERRAAATVAGRPASDGERLGTIWFAEDGTPAESIAISLGAVSARVLGSRVGGRSITSWPAALADAAIGRALGRVLAHEIGHYLLASPAHSKTGLMREGFDGAQLAAWDRRGFELHSGALPRLRARLARLEPGRRPLAATAAQP